MTVHYTTPPYISFHVKIYKARLYTKLFYAIILYSYIWMDGRMEVCNGNEVCDVKVQWKLHIGWKNAMEVECW